MISISGLALGEARISGGFWARKIDVVGRSMLPYQWAALNDEVPGAEPSHAVENIRIAAGEATGEFKGNIWQDSDVAKWIEAASYSLNSNRNPELEGKVEEAIELIGASQGEDGYINSYFSSIAPEKRWKDLVWGHELYCAGHLMEASVAHYEATGKRNFIGMMMKYADYMARAFGPGEGQIHACCGHPEVELALFRLFRATGEARYRDLALYFLDIRGQSPESFTDKEPLGFEIDIHRTRWYMRADYFQAHAPVREQRDAEGHSVRAMYLYSAMADAYMETRDPEILAALKSLWMSVTGRRMYLTGGIGSQAHAERFTCDWDLPSDTAYAETCASIGLALWALRMSAIDPDSRYADVAERVAYNGILSGVSLDGTRYFYVNPLEVDPRIAACRFDHAHVKTERVQWFGCACCPPNIARFLGSFGKYLYGNSDTTVWVHQYADSACELELRPGRVRLIQYTEFPWSGSVRLRVERAGAGEFAIGLRIPEWCGQWACAVNDSAAADGDANGDRACDGDANGDRAHDGDRAPGLGGDGARDTGVRGNLQKGYLMLRREWKTGDLIELDLEMPVRIVAADPRISELSGKLAIQRGPLIYCVESCDNGEDLHALLLDPQGPKSAVFDPKLMGGSVRIELAGFREAGFAEKTPTGLPYRSYAPDSRALLPVRIKAVPYHQWGNREAGGEMAVWIRGRM